MVPISCVNVAGGVATDAPTGEARISDHWKGIMTTPPGHVPPNRARRRAVIRMLSRKLTSDQREELDRPLQATELALALKSMNPKKSPGPDGWTAGFFQVAPEVFSEILLLVFNYTAGLQLPAASPRPAAAPPTSECGGSALWRTALVRRSRRR